MDSEAGITSDEGNTSLINLQAGGFSRGRAERSVLCAPMVMAAAKAAAGSDSSAVL